MCKRSKIDIGTMMISNNLGDTIGIRASEILVGIINKKRKLIIMLVQTEGKWKQITQA